MPKYRITGPDGGTYEINAPEGATEAQVLEFAKQNYGGAKPKQRVTAEEARDPSRIPAERYRAAGIEPPGRPDGSSGSWYSDYLSGVGKSLVDTGRGAAQYLVDATAGPGNVTSGLDAAAGLVGMIPGVRDAAVRQSDKMRAEEAERRRVLPSFTENPSFTAGNVIGTTAQLVGPGVAARGTQAARALLPTSVRGNVLQGALLGAVQPVAAEGERALNTSVGGFSGALGAGIPKAAGAAYRPVRNAIATALGSPVASATERRAAERITQAAANPAALRVPAPSQVPNVQRSLAEESLDPGIARLERQMRGSGDPGAFVPIDRANAVARVAAIQQIAGSDADMAAAIAARQQAYSGARDEAMQAGPVDIRQTLDALDEAIANSEGRSAIEPALRQLRARLAGEVELAPGLVTQNPESRINVLDNVRQDMGDMLAGRFGGDTSAALAGSREIMGIRDALNREVADQVPAFGQYLDAYRQGSLPINRMEIGRELLDRGAGGAVADPVTGIRPLTPAGFSRQTLDLDALAARATGFDKARADQILSPDDIARFNAVRDDLERQNFRATTATGGNSMTQERQEFARQMVRDAANSVPILGRFSQRLEAQGEQRVVEAVSQLVANPAEYRRVMESLPPQEREVANMVLLQLSARAGVAAPALAE